ncbi:MAG: hypothetical protein E7J25_01010 [Paeniclostridium sordellii]|nr:hypothetical protein [Peptostreptococcaceae bacterium]MDU7965419.1 hypothetical protein [Paeniclostridium sordellii]
MYKCIEGFMVDICDGDGFTVEESGFVVEEGSIWEVNEEAINVLGADVHLENNDSWIEISKETLEECFIKMK